MKRSKKAICLILSLAVCFACAIGSAPLTRAVGLMRLIIDGNTYSKVYTDTGSLALSHWFYDASEDVLKLENFGTSSSPKSSLFAYPYSGTITIELTGNNYITATRETAITIIGNVTFTGTGSLTISCPNSYCIYTQYGLNVRDGVSLNLNGLAGITAEKGFDIDTTGSINIRATSKCMYSYGDYNIKGGDISLNGRVGMYTSEGDVHMSGGETEIEITSTVMAIQVIGSSNYVEWSANATVTAGAAAPGSAITEYSNQLYFHAVFTGVPKLNPPRTIGWDQTFIGGSEENPVGRWSAVVNATGYEVKLYFKNDNNTYSLRETFVVTDALSCNFGGHFTTYGNYYFTVKALADDVNFLSSNESAKSASAYHFTGDVASRYYVTLPESEYFTVVPVSGSTVAYYGDDYSFTVDIDPAYTQSEILVWANGARVALRHGLYTVDNVTENITITIGELTMNTYTVNLPTSEAYTILPLPDYSTNVAYGGSYAFSIELTDIYMQSTPVVTTNGAVLTPRFGIIYTISNITADQNVEITGLIRDNYQVTFKQLDGTVISEQTVDHGYGVTQPAAPSLADGLTFVCWSNPDGTAYDFSTPVTEHKTLYARFAAPTDTDGYYLISTLDQLKWFRDEVMFGNGAINGRLAADISMNSGSYVLVGNEPVFSAAAETWQPIGGYDYTDSENYVRFYQGNFDGDGHTLSGFFAEYDAMHANASYLGVFGIVTASGSIKDLNVSTSSFSGYSNIGGIVGKCSGEISGCSSSAVCSGVENVGGIVGSAGGNITNCVNSGRVTVERYTSDESAAPIGGINAGGVAGIIDAGGVTVTGCTNSAAIAAYDCAGGIVGSSGANSVGFISCANSGAITSGVFAGGIAARSAAALTFTDCHNTASVSGSALAGGIAAQNTSAVYLRVYNTGAVTAAGGVAGGIVGSGSISASYCFNEGVVTALETAGGFSGKSDSVSLVQCHSFGAANAAQTNAVCCVYTSAIASQSYYCAESFTSAACGTAAINDWFYSGYLAFVMNRQNGSGFWAQGAFCPVFAGESLTAITSIAFGGSGTFSAPYLISNEREMRMMQAAVNNETGFSDKHFSLTADITLHNSDTENNFVPIGTELVPFSGSFNGNNHTISGVNMRLSTDNVGLFGRIENSLIENLTLNDCTIVGNTNVGAIVGQNLAGSVNSCKVTNSAVSGYMNVGGVIGHQTGDAYRNENHATVTGTLSIGGIVGFNEDNTVSSCFNYGTVSGVDGEQTDASEAGGVAGKSFGTLLDCGNSAAVSSTDFAGGVVGINYNALASCFNCGTVTSPGRFGAINAENQSDNELEYCYYLAGCAAQGGCEDGTSQTVTQLTNGTTAYHLNYDGQAVSWAQGASHPIIAAEDGSDAVVFGVTFISFGEEYYFAATMPQGSIAAPVQPVADGYNFLYWDTPFSCVEDNLVTHAVFDRSSLITFVPTATTGSIDYDDGSIIVGIEPADEMTAGELRAQIANEKIVINDADGINELAESDRIYTGAMVQLYEEPGVYYHTAWVVIYGDVNSDGAVDSIDAFIFNMLLGGMMNYEELSYAQKYAADVNGDGAFTQADADLLESYLLRDSTINQSRYS